MSGPDERSVPNGEAGDRTRRRRGVAVVLGVVALSAVLMALSWPGIDRYDSVDEPGYAAGGAFLAEGLTPPYRAGPAGPMTWAGWAWVNADALLRLADLRNDETNRAALAQAPAALKPYVALNAAVFAVHRDARPLRGFLLACGAALWLAGTAAAAGLGWRHAGAAGAVLTGGLWATLPLFVDLSTETRPYSWAWAAAAIAVWLANRARTGRGEAACAVAFGLATASRVEMLAAVPLLVWFFHRPGEGAASLGRRTLVLAIQSAAVAVLAAPWLVTSLLSNLKSIVGVYLIKLARQAGEWATFAAGTSEPPSLRNDVVAVFWDQGLALAVVLVVLGLTVAFVRNARRDGEADSKSLGRVRAGVLGILVALSLLAAMRQAGHAANHNAWAFITIVLATAPALGVVGQLWGEPGRGRAGVVSLAVAALVVALPLAQSLRGVTSPPRFDGGAAAVANVPAGAVVYSETTLVSPLPTLASARRQWAWYNDRGWRRKIAQIAGEFAGDESAADEAVEAVDLAEMPVAASDDTAIKERGEFWALLVLASRPALGVPRYDLRLMGQRRALGLDLPAPAAGEAASSGPPAAVYVHLGRPLPEFGPPLASWPGEGEARGYFVYRVAPPPPLP